MRTRAHENSTTRKLDNSTHLLVLLCSCALVTIYLTNPAHAGSVQFNTYYPSPFGMYDRLRLVPRAEPAEPCDPGTLHVNLSSQLMFCNNSGAWDIVGINYWSLNAGNDIYVTNTSAKVGIGTTTPESVLHIAQSLPDGTVDALRLNNTASQSSSWIVFRESTQLANFKIKYHSNADGERNWLEFWGSAFGPLRPRLTLQRDYSPSDAPYYPIGGVMVGTPEDYSPSAKFTVMNEGINGAGVEDILHLYDDTTRVLTVLNNGNVGIGTPTPNERLEINGNLRLPYTTATAGVINLAGSRFIHNYGPTPATDNNTFAGLNAGNFTLTGQNNTGIGNETLKVLTSGTENTSAGYYALSQNTDGLTNTAIGVSALYSNTTGSSNTAIGHGAMYQKNADGEDNVSLGAWTLGYLGAESRNTAIGTFTLYFHGGLLCPARDNTAVGREALVGWAETCGIDQNTAVGAGALKGLKTGDGNIAIGYLAENSFRSFNHNIIIGTEITFPTPIANNQLNIANIIFGTTLDGLGTTIPVNGKIGIGTSTPSTRLEIADGLTKATGGLIVELRTLNPGGAVNGQMWLCTDAGANPGLYCDGLAN